MAKYRVGVIGAGRKGTQHARAYDLNPLSEIVAVADTDKANRQLFSRRFGVPGYAEAGVRAIVCEKHMAARDASASSTASRPSGTARPMPAARVSTWRVRAAC